MKNEIRLEVFSEIIIFSSKWNDKKYFKNSVINLFKEIALKFRYLIVKNILQIFLHPLSLIF